MESYERFEKEWARWAGVENVVACSSGTAALHLALEALRLPQGSEVILPDYTMVACARAVTLAGLVPVFIDCGKDLLIDPELISQYVDKHPSKWLKQPVAIMPVHVYGRSCNMPAIHDIAAKYDLAVIEDLAEAHGIPPHPNTDAACWSFYKNKIVAGEEGGAISFTGGREPEYALAKKLRSLGFTEEHDYTHIPRGHNYRMSNSHAKIILDSTTNRWGCLQDATANLGHRREVEGWYDKFCPQEWCQPKRDAVWVYDLRISNLLYLQRPVIEALRNVGIAARYGFKPMSTQEEYKTCRKVGGNEALSASKEVIYLPVQPGITTPDKCREAFDIIKSIVGDY